MCLVQLLKYSVTGSLYSFKNRSFFCFYESQMCIDKLVIQSRKFINIAVRCWLMQNSFYLLDGRFNFAIHYVGLTVIVNAHQHDRFIPKRFLLSAKEFPDRLIILCKLTEIIQLCINKRKELRRIFCVKHIYQKHFAICNDFPSGIGRLIFVFYL